jgi:hypothetical protein
LFAQVVDDLERTWEMEVVEKSQKFKVNSDGSGELI